MCVCLSEVALYWGPGPGVGHERRTHAASPHRLKNKKQNILPRPPLAEPVHCMMKFGTALSLSLLSPCLFFSLFVSALPFFGPGPILLPAGLAHDPGGCGALLCLHLLGELSAPFFSPLPVCQSVSGQAVSCCSFFLFPLMGATVWLRLSPLFFLL